MEAMVSAVGLTHEDVVAVWGEDNVVRVPRPDAEGLGLPAGAQRVLAEIGLPRKADQLFARDRPELIPAGDGVRQYCKIGSDYGTDICVAADSGAVLSLSHSAEYPDRFVNSGLECFVEFLCRVVTERRRFPALGDSEIDALIEHLEAGLRARDAEAFAGLDHWWSVIFEQMRDGLL